MGETSIPCREPTRDRLEELRGNEFKSWNTFLDRMADVWEDFDELVENVDGNSRDVDTDELARAVAKELDYAALADSVAEEVVRRLQ